MRNRVTSLAAVFFALQSNCALARSGVSKCALPPGWSAVEQRRPRYVIFGEQHGTRESPQLVAAVACALARKGQRILVAVEIASASNAELQRLWWTPTVGFARRLLTDLPYFAERDDGVASVAMVEMLEKLHQLSQGGKSIDVVAFNGARDAAQVRRWRDLPGQGPHEAAQAENIAEAVAKRPYDRVLVLVGNLHAQIRPIRWPSATFEPMAVRLARTGSLVSLNQGFAAGTLWNCITKSDVVIPSNGAIADDQIDCGLHGHLPAPVPSASVTIKMSEAGNRSSKYHGEYWFPVVHGSPPARQVMN